MAGVKTVEFRKINVSRNLTHVIVYATAPDKKIVGYFSIKRMVAAAPSTLWRWFGKAGRVSKKDFVAYYNGADIGVAIVIDRVFRFACPA